MGEEFFEELRRESWKASIQRERIRRKQIEAINKTLILINKLSERINEVGAGIDKKVYTILKNTVVWLKNINQGISELIDTFEEISADELSSKWKNVSRNIELFVEEFSSIELGENIKRELGRLRKDKDILDLIIKDMYAGKDFIKNKIIELQHRINGLIELIVNSL